MLLKTKFIYLIVLVISSFIIIISFNLFYSFQRTKFITLEKDGFVSISYLQKISIAGKELLYGSYLDAAYDGWKTVTVKGDAQIKNFFNSKLLKKLTTENNEIFYNKIVTVNWQQTLSALNDVGGKLKLLKEIDPAATSGVVFLVENGKTGFDYHDLYESILKTDEMLNGSFTGNFENLNTSINNELNKLETKNNITLLILSLIIILTFVIVFLRFIRDLNKKFNNIHGVMKSVSERDFSTIIECKDNDEISDLSKYLSCSLNTVKDFFSMIKSSSSNVSDLSENVSTELSVTNASLIEIDGSIKTIKSEFEKLNENILMSSDSSKDIQENINSLATQIQTQAATVVQSSSSIEEISASINNIAEITRKKKDAAILFADLIKKTESDVANTNSYIKEINSNTQIIQEILTMLNGISAQTNILSMNAAIESARAGTAGRGFSIVAGEIRELADSTGVNSKKIQNLIRQITAIVAKTLEISSGNLRSFKTIIAEADNFIILFQEISNALDEMSLGSREILNVNRILNDLTLDVKNRYGLIIKENEGIGSAALNLNNISSGIFKNITNIYQSIEKIINSTNDILQKQNNTKNNINNMNIELMKFKT